MSNYSDTGIEFDPTTASLDDLVRHFDQADPEGLSASLTLRGVTLPRRVWATFDAADHETLVRALFHVFTIPRLEARLLINAWFRGARPSGWEPIPD